MDWHTQFKIGGYCVSNDGIMLPRSSEVHLCHIVRNVQVSKRLRMVTRRVSHDGNARIAATSLPAYRHGQEAPGNEAHVRTVVLSRGIVECPGGHIPSGDQFGIALGSYFCQAALRKARASGPHDRHGTG